MSIHNLSKVILGKKENIGLYLYKITYNRILFYFVKIPQVRGYTMFETLKEAQLFIDKYLIRLGKSPIYILKKK